MNARHPRIARAVRHHGFGLVEIMVGVTIGLLALLIVYQVLALSEGYRRTTTAGGDAQSAGMISSFLLAQDVSNGGNILSDSAQELATCPALPLGAPTFNNTWRPIPVLIRDGGNDATSDAISVFYGVNPRLVTPVDIMRNAPPGALLKVQSPLGFATNDMFVVADTAVGNCEMGRVTNITPDDRVPSTPGVIDLTPTPLALTYPQGSTWVINLGAANAVRKLRFEVVGTVLRSQDLIGGGVANPIASNVVLMKAQYGLDLLPAPTGDNVIDTWVSARNAPWDEASVLAAPLAQLRAIKAVRIALIVRSTQFERPLDAEGRAAVTDLSGDYTTPILFACYGMLPCAEIPPTLLPGTANYRYRVFEQVIPLRNQIWNP